MLKANLDKYSNATAIHAIHATSEALKVDRIARIARVQVASPIKTSDETISNWWLLTFDSSTMETAIWPPCKRAEALELNPQAIDALPIASPVNEAMEELNHG